jgi:hypothetical protein
MLATCAGGLRSGLDFHMGRFPVSVKRQDTEKARQWRKRIREAARSGLSVREFCRQRKLKVGQFYWWQHRLKVTRPTPARRKPGAGGDAASFALVSDEPGVLEAGIELVLNDGSRLRIRKGVDEETLRAVLAAVESSGC